MLAEKRPVELGFEGYPAKRARHLHDQENATPVTFSQRPAGWDENLAGLEMLFPQLPLGVISSILESTHNQAQQAMETLQKLCDGGAASPSASAEKSAPSPMTQVKQRKRAAEVQGGREEHIRHWAEVVVQRLAGSPSVQEAANRAHELLTLFEQEVKAAIESQGQERVAELEHKVAALQERTRIFLRAIHVLGERNRRMQPYREDNERLKSELAAAKEQLQRVEQSNSVLQWHVQQRLSGPSGGGFGFGSFSGGPGIC